MIMCPGCQHLEVEGALFCGECGAQLTSVQTLVTQNIGTNEMHGETEKTAHKHQYDKKTSGAITLQILEGGQFLPLADRTEFTMGRVSDGQPIMPDIDLTPYKAYECGVSRLHAVLKKKSDKVVIMDLGSSNGTYLNGTRLSPENEHSLHHGSIISLGKLKIQFLLQG
ncbi:MAG: FHA domain-containing protein [Anaerolineae bacterium]|jgi:pSer/pThr/pTyr-binding forkhead associated (FHA) protein|nr:FHA domain-containing protein [Anaerolineae bacterium]MBT7069726.1 FHA domain-containing protein [Anaerolineae bacterium]MBT7326740.1 FHA domain-containing protein [Anaerolineae bacterium]